MITVRKGGVFIQRLIQRKKNEGKKNTDPRVQMIYKSESLPMKYKHVPLFPKSSALAEGSSMFYSTLTPSRAAGLSKTFLFRIFRARFPSEFSHITCDERVLIPVQIGHHVLHIAV